MNRRVTASAPGKLMLFGEHAVVHNHPCLVSAVGMRVSVIAEKTDGNTVDISTARQSRQVRIAELTGGQFLSQDTAFVEAAIAQVMQKYHVQSGLRISTHGPENSFGLGSSSAITVATCAVLCELFGFKPSQRELFDLTYAAVLAVQGKGSGFDVASAIYGGTIYFLTGGAEIEPLAVGDLPIVIGYSGEKVGTVGLVSSVTDLLQHYPDVIGHVFDAVEKIVGRAKRGLLDCDWRTVGDLMNINQGLMDAVGVNTPQLAKTIFAAREAGALGAKLSGAGGGDCMFALVEPERRADVEQAIERAGAKVLNLEINTRGVSID